MNNLSALNLPNLLTLGNLFCGCCAVLFLMHGMPQTAVWFTAASFVLDYGDGMAARALKIKSALGKELDSLADVISFGLAPGAMLYLLLANADYQGQDCPIVTAALPAFLLSAFSGLRLGLFNLDTRQTTYFLGLSTPACTILVMGITLSAYQNSFGFGDWLSVNKWFIYLLIPVLCALLISEIPMFGLKLRRMDWKSNLPLLTALLMFVVLVYTVGAPAFSIMVAAYIAASIIFRKKVVE